MPIAAPNRTIPTKIVFSLKINIEAIPSPTTPVIIVLDVLSQITPMINPQIYVQERPGRRSQIRMRFTDGEMTPDVSVTDIRLYEADHVTPDLATVERMKQALAQ